MSASQSRGAENAAGARGEAGSYFDKEIKTYRFEQAQDRFNSF